MNPLSLSFSKVPYPQVKGLHEVGNSLGKYSLKDARNIVSNCSLGTFDVKACTVVLMNNGKKNYMAHLDPEQVSPRRAEAGLAKQIDKMRENFEDINALILGAWNSSNKASFELPVAIANLFDKLEVDFSMICGKPKEAAPESVVVRGNYAKIISDKFKDIFAKLDVKNATKDEIQEALENHYEIVELSENMPVNLIDKFSNSTQAVANKNMNSTRA